MHLSIKYFILKRNKKKNMNEKKARIRRCEPEIPGGRMVGMCVESLRNFLTFLVTFCVKAKSNQSQEQKCCIRYVNDKLPL